MQPHWAHCWLRERMSRPRAGGTRAFTAKWACAAVVGRELPLKQDRINSSI